MAQAAATAQQRQLTALEHLHELWLRLAGSLLVMAVGGSLTYLFRLQIIKFLQRPLHEQLYYTSPMGSFQFVMQVCLLCGFILALPLLIYNVLRFVEPAFESRFSRSLLLAVIGASLGLAAAGIAFGYYLTLPVALQFFSSVGTSTLHPLITINEYFSFVVGYVATFAVVFQLPLLILFINRIRPLKPGGLSRPRKHVYVGAFTVSLIMPSSPDPLSQVSLAIPIIVLYEVSVVLVWYVNRRAARRAPRRQREAPREMVSRRAPRSATPADPSARAPAQPLSVSQASMHSHRLATGRTRSRTRALMADVQPQRRSYQVPLPRPLYTQRPNLRRPPRLIDIVL